MNSDFSQHLASLLKQSEIEGWETNYNLHGARPRGFRLDFAFPDCMLAIETQGLVIEKHNLAVARGWRLLYVTPGMLKKDPVSFIALVKQMLGTNLKSLVDEFSIELAPLLIDLGLPETNIEDAVFVAEDLLEKIILKYLTEICATHHQH